jgi:hypothetical protein
LSKCGVVLSFLALCSRLVSTTCPSVLIYAEVLGKRLLCFLLPPPLVGAAMTRSMESSDGSCIDGRWGRGIGNFMDQQSHTIIVVSFARWGRLMEE